MQVSGKRTNRPFDRYRTIKKEGIENIIKDIQKEIKENINKKSHGTEISIETESKEMRKIIEMDTKIKTEEEKKETFHSNH